MKKWNTEFICPHCYQSIAEEDLQKEKQTFILQQYKKQLDSLKSELEQEKEKIRNEKTNQLIYIQEEHDKNHIKWLPEEDWYCVDRFIKNYFERLIKYGNTLKSKNMELEVNLYKQKFGDKRTDDSVKLKFHNIEHLAFKWVEENGNPYNIEIKKRMSSKTKQSIKAWENQVEKYTQTISKWLKK